jgi:phosphomannomutase
MKSQQAVHPSIFRAYDIRGVVGDTLTADSVYAIGLGNRCGRKKYCSGP